MQRHQRPLQSSYPSSSYRKNIPVLQWAPTVTPQTYFNDGTPRHNTHQAYNCNPHVPASAESIPPSLYTPTPFDSAARATAKPARRATPHSRRTHAPPCEVRREHWFTGNFIQIKKRIGAGGFGSAFSAELRTYVYDRLSEGSNVAIKVVCKRAQYGYIHGRSDLLRELDVMKSANHNRLRWLNEALLSWDDDKHVYFVMVRIIY